MATVVTLKILQTTKNVPDTMTSSNCSSSNQRGGGGGGGGEGPFLLIHFSIAFPFIL